MPADRLDPHRARLVTPVAALLLLALGAIGCRSLPDRSAPSVASPRERGDALYAAGEYAPAAQAYREHLNRHPDAPRSDRVLFRLAAIHLLPDSSAHAPATGIEYLDRLIREHPESPLTEPARVLRSLQGTVEDLEERSESQKERLDDLAERLEALKRIDLERSREPPPK